MPKSIRNFALALALTFSLTAAPMVHADIMGTNPPPQVSDNSMSTFAVFASVLLSLYRF